MSTSDSKLSIEQLHRYCATDSFDFDSTENLAPLDGIIGQDRAVRAVNFGINMDSPGYHLFVLGPVGTGKATTIRQFLEQKSAAEPVPDDWCYVYNFDITEAPSTIRLPFGQGRAFEDDMNHLIDELKNEIPQVFEREEYQQLQEELDEEFQEQRETLFKQVETAASERNFSLVQKPQGILFVPMVEGKPITQQQFDSLDDEKREVMEKDLEHLHGEMRDAMRQIHRMQQENREKARELERQTIEFAVELLLEDLRNQYAKHERILSFLDAVSTDILDTVQEYKQRERLASAFPDLAAEVPILNFDHYQVNLLVDNTHTEGAPVVVEINPSYHNLVGRVEYDMQMGAFVTDYTMIKAGALHRANGGYLVLEAQEILTKPFAWDALKRVLKNKEIRMEVMGDELRTTVTRSLEPQAIPLDIKVVLVGSPMVYYLLYQYDNDFRELFKVKAEFAHEMTWDDVSIQQYAQFIGTLCRTEKLPHFDPSGVGRIIEHSARLVANQNKLSTQFAEIVDLIREAAYWASLNDHQHVNANDVQHAINEREYRSNLAEEMIHELIADGTILIDTEGEVIGQVNGIAVLQHGDFAFGKPSRITARTYVGGAGVINIERETLLGGQIHNKGVFILSGYIGGQYATDSPLTFSASITFEQLYSGVEGDSASSAELYALLSSLSGYPIRQDLAVTGSVNQFGQIQAIGGVNEKIEGVYAVCQERGLTGTQGVLIPQSNIKHLMLKEEVVQAVRDGQFHIYSIATVDEGIALLTGREVGERQDDGTYPKDTVHGAVQHRLQEFADKVKAMTHPESGKES